MLTPYTIFHLGSRLSLCPQIQHLQRAVICLLLQSLNDEFQVSGPCQVSAIQENWVG